MRLARPAIPLALGCAVLVAAGAPAGASVQFFVNDPAGFAAALSGAPLMGLEDWSSAGNAAATVLDAPLQPGVAEPPFPNGTNAASGITVQPNTGGADGSLPTAGDTLYFAPAGFACVSGVFQPSHQLGANARGYSFDVLLGDVGPTVPSAISLTPLFYRTHGQADVVTVSVEVYDGGNALVGSVSVPGVTDCLETAFLGILGAPGEIRRVNLYAGDDDVPGVDNLRVYAAPEPLGGGAGALLALGALAARWRGRQWNSE